MRAVKRNWNTWDTVLPGENCNPSQLDEDTIWTIMGNIYSFEMQPQILATHPRLCFHLKLLSSKGKGLQFILSDIWVAVATVVLLYTSSPPSGLLQPQTQLLTHIHTQWLSRQMAGARWRALLNSWQHWGAISCNMPHEHTEAECTDRWCVSSQSKRRNTTEGASLHWQGCIRLIMRKLCIACWSSWDGLVHLRDKEKPCKTVNEMRGENARWEGTERENLNNGVKPKNTGPVMDAALRQSELLRGERRGGASCWQCQGLYQLVSVSATEMNAWATAFYMCTTYECTAELQAHTFSMQCCSQQCL